jgi:hypothetical protein
VRLAQSTRVSSDLIEEYINKGKSDQTRSKTAPENGRMMTQRSAGWQDDPVFVGRIECLAFCRVSRCCQLLVQLLAGLLTWREGGRPRSYDSAHLLGVGVSQSEPGVQMLSTNDEFGVDLSFSGNATARIAVLAMARNRRTQKKSTAEAKYFISVIRASSAECSTRAALQYGWADRHRTLVSFLFDQTRPMRSLLIRGALHVVMGGCLSPAHRSN